MSEILKRPILALASGPAAAPAAALHYARTLSSRDLICIDMGGTSFEVCLIRDGQAAMSRELRVADQPIGVPAVELHSIGAGGGSIAWVDNGGALRVGPQSAGAVPGPACYASGGTQPTVTDANVVLGYLAPSAFLGGRRSLDAELAAAALEHGVARPLGLPLTKAARGVIMVVNSNMVSAIRAVSLERGIDPRRFDLVAGGGAGGLHAAALARALGIRRVLIPPEAGTLCAFGMTVTDVRTDRACTHYGLTSGLNSERVEAIFTELEQAASDQLRTQGFTGDSIRLERWADARYPGQVHEVTIPIANDVASGDVIFQIERTFHIEHERLYTYKREDLPIELLHWRVTGRGLTPPPRAHPAHDGTRQTRQANDSRTIQLAEGPARADIFDAQGLVVGQRIAGPAIVQAATTTVLIPPGDELRVASDGTLVISLPETSEPSYP